MKIISNHFSINMDFLWLVMWLGLLGFARIGIKAQKCLWVLFFYNNNHQLNIVKQQFRLLLRFSLSLSLSFFVENLYHL